MTKYSSVLLIIPRSLYIIPFAHYLFVNLSTEQNPSEINPKFKKKREKKETFLSTAFSMWRIIDGQCKLDVTTVTEDNIVMMLSTMGTHCVVCLYRNPTSLTRSSENYRIRCSVGQHLQFPGFSNKVAVVTLQTLQLCFSSKLKKRKVYKQISTN